MKQWLRLKVGILLVVMALSVFAGNSSAFAVDAYTRGFTTSITYQNVGTSLANISLDIYSQSTGTAIVSGIPFTLPAGASASFFVGGLNQLSSGFQGSAVLSADQPLIATAVQSDVGTGERVINRALSNGFSQGSNKVLIATILKTQFGPNTSRFSVQNVDTTAADVTVKFFAAGATTPIHTVPVLNLPPNSAKYFDAGTITELPAGFNGSVTIDAVKTGTTTGGSVVATAMELGTTLPTVYAFEGIPASDAANTIYMATALCQVFGGQSSAYAIQNTSSTAGENAVITITYKSTAGTTFATDPVTVAPGAKTSHQACSKVPAGFSGSATITSTGAKIVAIGKVTGAGITSAFISATGGTNKIAAPYVRWSNTRWNTGDRVRQHSDLAIQNVGANIPAGGLVVKYIDKDGKLVGTHTIAAAILSGGKVNSNPNQATPNPGYSGTTTLGEFGYVNASATAVGGGASIEGPAGSQLIGIVRVTSFPATGLVGEDYSIIPVQ